MGLQRQSDEQLLSTARPGLAGPAFAEFYRRHVQLVVAFHMRRVRDAELASDLTAETFAQALSSRDRFKARGAGSAAGWLYAIATNVAAGSRRRAASELGTRHKLGLERPPLDDEQRRVIDQLGADDQLVGALEQLPAEQRDVIRAHVLDERSYEQIAADTALAPATVRKRVSRGLAALRRDLKEPS